MQTVFENQQTDGTKEGKLQWERRFLTMLSDRDRFKQIGLCLAEPFQEHNIQYVVAFEALGFPLGSMVAGVLGVGLVLLRKTAPGTLVEDFETETFKDYHGDDRAFKVRCDTFPANSRILVVDDYYETGAQLRAAINLITRLESTVVAATFCGRRILRGENAKTSDPCDIYIPQEMTGLILGRLV